MWKWCGEGALLAILGEYTWKKGVCNESLRDRMIYSWVGVMMIE